MNGIPLWPKVIRAEARVTCRSITNPGHNGQQGARLIIAEIEVSYRQDESSTGISPPASNPPMLDRGIEIHSGGSLVRFMPA